VVPSEQFRPSARQIADLISTDIAAGRLAVGDRVPSVRELTTTHHVASATAHSALQLLIREGAVVAVPGRGSFVADQSVSNGHATEPNSARIGALEARVAALEARLAAIEDRRST
jgi:DNA-binding GntR family transcriptional regulator